MATQEELIKTLPEGYDYKLSPENMNDGFGNCNREFRIQLNTPASIMEWMTKYCAMNNVVWRSKRTHAVTGQRVLLKLDLRCQHNTDKRTRTSGKRLSKNTNCPAMMKVTLNSYIKLSKSKIKNSLNENWPCIVELIDKHNHDVSLRFQGLSEETKKKLLHLYHEGHTPSSAIKFLKAELALETHNEEYETVTADSRFLPTISICGHLYDSEFKRQSSEASESSSSSTGKDINSVIDTYCKNCKGKAVIGQHGKHSYVTLCSPIMQRAHAFLRQSSELVFVDASGGKGRQKHRVYFFITPTAAGGIPLGVVITEEDSETVLAKALEDLKKCFPEEAFYGKGYPTIFLTDNNPKEKNILKKQFPESSLLLCQYRVLKGLWLWLCDPKSLIEPTDRQELYFVFKELVYAETESALNKSFNRIQELPSVLKYAQYIVYLEEKLEIKKQWSSCFRKHMPITCNNSTNYAEIVFRALKECILERVSTFKLTQLFNFIVTKYEDYLERSFVDFCHDRLPKNLIQRLVPFDTAHFGPYDISKHPQLQGCYIVDSKKDMNHSVCTVDIQNSFCSCDTSYTGKICSHIATVMTEYSTIEDTFILVDSEFKEILFEVATGFKPSSGWFDSLKEQVEETSYDSVESMENEDCAIDLEEDSVEDIVDGVRQIWKKMEDLIQTNPSLFVSAGRKMIRNAKEISSENGLALAMCSFGKYRDSKEMCDASSFGKCTGQRNLRKKIKIEND